MKLHHSVIEKLVRIVDLHGGRKDDVRLREEITKLDLTSYTQKTNNTVLVLTEDIQEAKDEAIRVSQARTLRNH